MNILPQRWHRNSVLSTETCMIRFDIGWSKTTVFLEAKIYLKCSRIQFCNCPDMTTNGMTSNMRKDWLPNWENMKTQECGGKILIKIN